MNAGTKLRLLFLLCLVTIRGMAQEQPGSGTPVFRSESRLVVVDAVVTDKKGQTLPDLTAKDFHVWEDNKEHPIKSVFRQTPDSPDSRSYIVLLFAPVAASEASYLRSKIQEYVTGMASPDRLIAVAAYSGVGGEVRLLETFTSDAEALSRKVAEALRGGASIPETDRGVMSDFYLYDRAGRFEDDQMGIAIPNSGRNLALGVGAIARNLRSLPGRKAVVVIAPGLQLGVQEHELVPVINSCNRANVAVYALDIRHDASHDDAFDPLTEGTGGFSAQNPNNVLGALHRVAREQDERWVVTYSPAQSKEDSCHTIKLTVDRPGVKVRARNAYCNFKPNDPLAETAIGRELEARAVASNPGNIPASMRTSYFYAGPNSARVHLTADLSTQTLRFEKRGKGFHAEVNVLGIVATPEGETATRFTDALEFNFGNKDQVEQFQRNPYHYDRQFVTGPGRYSVKLILSSGQDNFARLEAPLVIDQNDGTQMTIGGLALCRETRSAAASESSIALLSNKVSLVSQGTEFVPAGSTQLKRTDTAGLYFELYEPASGTSPATVMFRIRVLDKKTGAVALDSQPMSIDAAKWNKAAIPVGWKFPMDKLVRGSYIVDVVAMDSSGAKPLARTMNIDVE